MTVSRFRVSRMDCSAEEQLVRLQLADLGGVNQVAVDLDERCVLVDHHGSTDEILAALDSLNLDTEHLDDSTDGELEPETAQQRRGLAIAFVINAGFFVAELSVGLLSRSMGLIADALDMGADASVYALSLFAVTATAAKKRQLARTSGYLQAGLAAVGLIEVVRRFSVGDELPEPSSMIVLSLLALVGNLATLYILNRVRSDEAHFQASWIFTANDIKVNGLVIAAAIGVATTNSAIPDLAAGTIIFLVVANGARRILGISK